MIGTNLEIESEIEEASLKLDQLRNEFECIDISEEIWIYSKDLLRNISDKFWKTFGRHLSKPKYTFIENDIEIRWVKDGFKLVLNISDDINDVILYIKRKEKNQYICKPVPKNEIIDYVIFWLDQL